MTNLTNEELQNIDGGGSLPALHLVLPTLPSLCLIPLPAFAPRARQCNYTFQR